MSAGGESRLSGIAYDQRERDLARFVESETDEVIAQVVTQFIAADSDAQRLVRDGLDDRDLYTVRTFSQRRAVSALRMKSIGLATQGVLGIALIDRARIDFRDLSVDLPHFALYEVGGDPEAVLRRGAAISEPGTSQLFALAVRRARQPRALAQCLRVPVTSRYGFGLMDSFGHPFDTTTALPARAIEIADIIDSSTQYQTKSLIAGTELPPIWLEGPQTQTRAKIAAEAVRACVFITAEWAKQDSRDPSLLLFLAEGRDQTHARELMELGRARLRPGQHQTAIAHGSLALIVNASSGRRGETTPETEASLVAFVASLTGSVTDDAHK